MCLSAHCLGGNVIDQNSDQALVLVGMDSWLGFDALVPIRTDDMRPQLISLFLFLISSLLFKINTTHFIASIHFISLYRACWVSFMFAILESLVSFWWSGE